MEAFQLLFLLLASSHYLIYPIDGAIRSEKSTEKNSQNNIPSSVNGTINYVLAQTGGSAKLPCKFTGLSMVTWIRRKDRQILTLGRDRHVIDTRFMVVPNNPDWTLLIKNVRQEDAGLYECQIQTVPVQQRFVYLNITEAYSVISGSPEFHVKQGSSLRLECKLMASAEAPNFIFWFRGERMINYDVEPGVRVEETKNGSILVVDKVKITHDANYTCSPSNARSAYITIHVIEEEEEPAAMHDGDRRNLACISSINVTLIFLSFVSAEFAKRFYSYVNCVT